MEPRNGGEQVPLRIVELYRRLYRGRDIRHTSPHDIVGCSLEGVRVHLAQGVQGGDHGVSEAQRNCSARVVQPLQVEGVVAGLIA